MKIAIDARMIRTSTGRYIDNLLEQLQRIDHDNNYIVLLLKKDFDGWQPTAANFHKAVADYPIYTFREQLAFAWQLYRLRADLVHFTMPQQPMLYFGRHITTVHDLTLLSELTTRLNLGPIKKFYKYRLKPLVFRLAIWWFVHSSRRIIVPTQFVKDEVARRLRVRPGKIVVTYEAADRLGDHPQRPETIGEHDKFIMYQGNYYPYKNVWRLIQGFAQLRRPNLKLVLVGKADSLNLELQRRAREAGITNVVFAGFLPDNQSGWLYQHAQAFVTASLYEGFGLSALEAMAYGTPTLSSRISCMPEVYGDGAEYFDPHNPADIAAKIAVVLDNPARQEELRRRGLAQAKKYSWAKMARETLAVYQSFS